MASDRIDSIKHTDSRSQFRSGLPGIRGSDQPKWLIQDVNPSNLPPIFVLEARFRPEKCGPDCHGPAPLLPMEAPSPACGAGLGWGCGAGPWPLRSLYARRPDGRLQLPNGAFKAAPPGSWQNHCPSPVGTGCGHRSLMGLRTPPPGGRGRDRPGPPSWRTTTGAGAYSSPRSSCQPRSSPNSKLYTCRPSGKAAFRRRSNSA